MQGRPRKYEQPVRVQFIWEHEKLERLREIAKLHSTDVSTLIQQALDNSFILPIDANNVGKKA